MVDSELPRLALEMRSDSLLVPNPDDLDSYQSENRIGRVVFRRRWDIELAVLEVRKPKFGVLEDLTRHESSPRPEVLKDLVEICARGEGDHRLRSVVDDSSGRDYREASMERQTNVQFIGVAGWTEIGTKPSRHGSVVPNSNCPWRVTLTGVGAGRRRRYLSPVR